MGTLAISCIPSIAPPYPPIVLNLNTLNFYTFKTLDLSNASALLSKLNLTPTLMCPASYQFSMMNREDFIKTGALGLVGLAATPALGTTLLQEPKSVIDAKRIKEFVVAGHSDLDKVKSMLAEQPSLLNSRYDWGNGDFEEAIEGAGHLGNKEIANYLIEQGSRVNLFVLTMLGKDQIVLPTLEEYPNLITSKGAHGFSLLHHAKVGGSDAQKIFDYLTEKGLTTTKF